MKKAHQVFILHFALKKRAFIEEIHEKQEQVSSVIYISLMIHTQWLQYIIVLFVDIVCV